MYVCMYIYIWKLECLKLWSIIYNLRHICIFIFGRDLFLIPPLEKVHGGDGSKPKERVIA